MKNRTNPIISGLSQQSPLEATNTATVAGIFTKSFISVLVFAITMIITMNTPALLMIVNSLPFLIIGYVLVFMMVFRVAKNPLAAKGALYFYSIFQGLVLASTVLFVNYYTQTNVGLMAGAVVVVIFFTMLFVYASFPGFYSKISPFLSMFMIAAFGILMMNLIFSIFGGGIRFGSDLDLFLTIGFALLASFSYLRDFSTIDNVVKGQLPKEYEYVAAFGLLTTTIWLYVEILRLITILIGRRD